MRSNIHNSRDADSEQPHVPCSHGSSFMVLNQTVHRDPLIYDAFLAKIISINRYPNCHLSRLSFGSLFSNNFQMSERRKLVKP